MNDVLLALWLNSSEATAHLTSAQPAAPVVEPSSMRTMARFEVRRPLRRRSAAFRLSPTRC